MYINCSNNNDNNNNNNNEDGEGEEEKELKTVRKKVRRRNAGEVEKFYKNKKTDLRE